MCVDYRGFNQLTIKDWYHYLWFQDYCINSVMPRCTPRSTCVVHIIWCIFDKMMNGKLHYIHAMAILSMLWCPLALRMHLLSFNTSWIMFFMSTWMISWSITLMTSSFSQRTWKSMDGMFKLFWTNLEKSNFMPSWKNVNFIKPKWNFSTTSFLEMVCTWIFTRFKPLWIGLP